MLNQRLVAAVAAVGMVSGVVGLDCKDPTVTIDSAAAATSAAACTAIPGAVVITRGAGTMVDLSGELGEIGGDLTSKDNDVILTLKSSSLETIGGAFDLQNVTKLQTLDMQKLGEVGSINWATLSALGRPTFGNPGITKAKSVTIADTFLETLEGINVQTVGDMNINNNRRLTKFSSSIKSLSNVLLVQANGLNLTMELPNLQWIANMTINNVTSFSVPSLTTVNGSMRFDSNYFTNFIAPNLTEIQTGDLSFVSNPQLTNISLPGLETVGGGFTIANNSALESIDGFGGLTEVGGAIKLAGTYEDFAFPQLKDVKGTFDAASTKDIQKSCDSIDSLNGVIQGAEPRCEPENANAANDTSSANSEGGGSGNGNGGDNNENLASPLKMSTSALVTMAALGAFVTAFL